MAFPNLAPVQREWEFPEFPTIDYEGIGGNVITFEFGSIASDQPLSLVYELISESEIQQIRDHYLTQQSIRTFTLAAQNITGYENNTTIFNLNTLWLYDGEPEENAKSFDLYDITVNLRSVLP